MKASKLTIALIESSDCVSWLMEMHNAAPHWLERRTAANRLYDLLRR